MIIYGQALWILNVQYFPMFGMICVPFLHLRIDGNAISLLIGYKEIVLLYSLIELL